MKIPPGDIGGLDDADVHQPNDPLFGSNIVAEETIDPVLTNIDHDQCPSGWNCRFSDAAFAELDSDESLDLGEIAKPADIGETDIDPAGTTFEITGENTLSSVGDEIYYIGRSEVWQTAEVTDTCNYAIMNVVFQVRIICITTAEVTGDSDDPAEGDSGAPVVEPDEDNEVELLGTLFAGGIGVYSDEFDFSPIGNIYMELSLSSTWDSCVSGC